MPLFRSSYLIAGYLLAAYAFRKAYLSDRALRQAVEAAEWFEQAWHKADNV